MIKKYRIFLFSLVLCSFFPWKCESYMKKYEAIANRISEKTAESLNTKYHLTLMGIGGSMMDDIKKMGLSLGFNKKINIAEARTLLINSVNDYLENINNNEELRPFLHNFPFTSSNIDLRIFMYDPNNNRVAIGELVTICMLHGKLIYRRLGKNGDHETVLEESFDEGLQIVRESK